MKRLLCLLACMFALNTYAQDTKLMTPDEMKVAAQMVKDTSTRPYLVAWVEACTAKRWGDCQVTWWNLIEKGNLAQMENDGYPMWGFLKQPDANRVLMHMVAALNYPTYQANWDMEISTTVSYKDIPRIIDGRSALTNGLDHTIALKIIDERFRTKGIMFEVRNEMPTPKLEWLRLVALMFTVRNDPTSATQVLMTLQKYVKMNGDIAILYNENVKAIQQYQKAGDIK